jgi:succinate-semialdehyde dehydrogenase / glutarate-semialdehyde dehydrogenase
MSYRSINPFTEEVVAEYPDTTPAELERILASSHEAFRSVWSRATYRDRGTALSAAADLMEQRRDELARLATTEMGKRYPELLWEIDLCVDILRYYAVESERILASRALEVADGSARVDAYPLGVIFCIEPWNFPFYQLIRVAAPLLMAGNTVVMKHSSIVPGCALAIEKLFTDAGAPEGVYSNVFVTNEQSGEVIADDRVRGVALTGSNRAGASVGAAAGRAFKKVTLELGGSDAFIVLESADLDTAVELAVITRTLNTGQACAGAKRFIVHSRLHDAFVARLSERFASLTSGDPLDEATEFGPVASESALDHALEQIELATAHGATITAGGRRVERTGFFLEPTVLTNVHPDNPVFYEEIFAQVAMVFSVDDEDEAIRLANDSPFGLGGFVVGDAERAEHVAAQLETGMVFLNRAGDSAPNLPWGGVKNSGYGRELSEFGISEYVNWKLIRSA